MPGSVSIPAGDITTDVSITVRFAGFGFGLEQHFNKFGECLAGEFDLPEMVGDGDVDLWDAAALQRAIAGSVEPECWAAL